MRQYAIYGKAKGSKFKWGSVVVYQSEVNAKKALANVRRQAKMRSCTLYGLTITKAKRVQ